MKKKLSVPLITKTPPGPKDKLFWDTDAHGLGLKITPAGRRIYVFQYSRNNRTRRVTIGKHGSEFTLHEARSRARDLAHTVAKGGDPAAEIRRAKSIPTVGEFGPVYLERHAYIHKKERSAAEDARLLQATINPALGHLKIDGLTTNDVARFHQQLAKTPIIANRSLSLLSKMCNLAELWSFRDPQLGNPTKGIRKYKETKRKRFLSAEELIRLGKALRKLDATEHSSVIGIIRMLLLTGARRDEIRNLKWGDVDFERARLLITDSKTGEREIPLGKPALTLLKELPRGKDDVRVFPGTKKGGQFVGLQKAWRRVAAEAGLSDVRLHDLRHTYGAIGAGANLSLRIIGEILGHETPATTQRYAQLADAPITQSADLVAEEINAALDGNTAENVVHFPSRQCRGIKGSP